MQNYLKYGKVNTLWYKWLHCGNKLKKLRRQKFSHIHKNSFFSKNILPWIVASGYCSRGWVWFGDCSSE